MLDWRFECLVGTWLGVICVQESVLRVRVHGWCGACSVFCDVHFQAAAAASFSVSYASCVNTNGMSFRYPEGAEGNATMTKALDEATLSWLPFRRAKIARTGV